MSQAEVLVGADDINYVVGDDSPLLGGGLGGADIHETVDLAAIGIDDFPAQGLRQLNAHVALADACGADYTEQAVHFAPLISAVCLTMLKNSLALRLAPPTRAPSISGCLTNSAMFSAVTLPP